MTHWVDGGGGAALAMRTAADSVRDYRLWEGIVPDGEG